MVLLVVTVKVPVIVRGVPVPDNVIVPVPVVNTALAATVIFPAVIVGLLVAPVAPALVLSPTVRLLAMVYVPEPKT